MNQEKIGKFIAERRKIKKITQVNLAEKLNITDRAISKWENGKSMPDSSIMLELCNILGISVNELLSGELINMDDYDKKMEELLLDMAKKEELSNRRLLRAMYTILLSSLIFYLVSIILIAEFIPEGPMQVVYILSLTFIFLIFGFIGLKYEVDAGYYECKKCKNRFVPTYKAVLWSMHMGTTRHLKCPKCNTKSWCKKVLSKE